MFFLKDQNSNSSNIMVIKKHKKTPIVKDLRVSWCLMEDFFDEKRKFDDI